MRIVLKLYAFQVVAIELHIQHHYRFAFFHFITA